MAPLHQWPHKLKPVSELALSPTLQTRLELDSSIETRQRSTRSAPEAEMPPQILSGEADLYRQVPREPGTAWTLGLSHGGGLTGRSEPTLSRSVCAPRGFGCTCGHIASVRREPPVSSLCSTDAGQRCPCSGRIAGERGQQHGSSPAPLTHAAVTPEAVRGLSKFTEPRRIPDQVHQHLRGGTQAPVLGEASQVTRKRRPD